ncbi:SulP family inorganic anion transporter [Uliginosibacterium sp. sgz301328]|uniref:SulP family inorganic anion transporter n=1 Tax=Uliginosibacterium sp. sgz301328 TaxID=3243764 RepID=UPI00359D5E22
MQDTSSALMGRLASWIPGLPELLHYSRADVRADLFAGISIATIALPVSIAYAQLAGFSPVVGLYSAILPMIAYAFFGSSRQLIVGPDAATCAMISATLMPLAGGDPEHYHALAISLTLITGLLCIVAGRLRMGFLADLLSSPILIGLLNGVAVTIIVGQLGKIGGFSLEGKDFIGQVISIGRNISSLHLPTFLLSASLCVLYIALKRFWPKGPTALIVAVVAIGLNALLGLSAQGVATVGEIPSSVPRLHWPSLRHEELGSILPAAALLAFVSFSSGMLTARSFAARNGYTVDGNRELVAFGIVSIVSAMSQGFAVTGANSRTAVNDAAGGRTRMAQVFGALAILLALLFLTGPLALLPMAALGIILVVASSGLMNFSAYRRLWAFSRTECGVAVGTFVGVLLIGVMPGILLAIVLALLSFLHRVARPADYVLGVASDGELHAMRFHPDARSEPGLLAYRFVAPLIFFNAPYFRQRVEELIAEAEVPVRWVMIDGYTISHVDLTGAQLLSDMADELARRGITMAFGGRRNEIVLWLESRHLTQRDLRIKLFPSRRTAMTAFREARENGFVDMDEDRS